MDKLLNQEFVYRQIPVNYNGVGRLDEIRGNTVKFNQLLPISSISTQTSNNITFTNNNNGKWNVTGTASATTFLTILSDITLIANHKYYFYGLNKVYSDSESVALSIRTDGIATIIANTFGIPSIFTPLQDYNVDSVIIRIGNGTVVNDVITPQLFDLTAMGIHNLTTSAQVEEWLSTHIGKLDYYDFTLGDLISFKGTGLKVVGFNQWDEEWEEGTFNTANGNPIVASGQIRTKNLIRVLPNTNYYCKKGGLGNAWVFFYDGNNMLISGYSTGTQTVDNASAIGNSAFITPSNCSYIKFYLTSGYGGTYNNDVCINISDTSRNGEYEPYTESTLNLPTLENFPTGMNGIPNTNVYDRLTESSAEQYLGMVDLGTLDWVYSNNLFFSSPGQPLNTSKDGFAIECGRYSLYNSTSITNMPDKSITSYTSAITSLRGRVIIKDSSYTDATTFKTAMNGVMLIYELAEPITTDISTPLDLTYPIEAGGTEQILSVNTSTPTTSNILCDQSYSTGIVEVITHPMPESGGETLGDGKYLIGEEATINALPNEHYIFNNWSLDGEIVSTEEEYTFEVSDE